MPEFSVYNPVRLLFGPGRFGELGEHAAGLGKHALLVTGRSAMRKLGYLDRAVEMLRTAGLQVTVFDQVVPNPTASVVEAGAELARQQGADLVVALGGGSAMDTAKAIAVRATHDEPISHFVSAGPWGEKRVPGPQTLPIICVTTTAGTSSELTRFAVVTVEETKTKAAVVGDAIYARVSIADPLLTHKVPPRVTAATGVDVFCHAAEALVSSVATPYTDAMAREAIRLVVRWLPAAVRDGDNAQAREGMMLANVFAGYALSQLGGTIIHALEHPVSALHPEIAHGEGLAALLPAWARAYADIAPEKMAELARLMGAGELAKPQQAAELIEALLERIDLRVTLGELGVSPDEIDQIADGAMTYMKVALEKSPGPPTRQLLLDLLRASM